MLCSSGSDLGSCALGDAVAIGAGVGARVGHHPRRDPTRPVAAVRCLPGKLGDNYRVVRWTPRSEDRRLFEYFPTLEKADMAVTFTGPEPTPPHTALTVERSGEWAKFERWFWSQAPVRLVLVALPPWAHHEARMTRQRCIPAEG
jgi:hypothetical protein